MCGDHYSIYLQGRFFKNLKFELGMSSTHRWRPNLNLGFLNRTDSHEGVTIFSYLPEMSF